MAAKNLCIYHGNCADGFSAAWVVWKFWKKHSIDLLDFAFHPGVYGEVPPDVKEKHVIVVDFSYKKYVMFDICKQAAAVTILDHHKTAIEDLKSIEHLFKDRVFDVERSGAMIAWNYFFPEEEPPQLLKHVQDRDLWQFKLPGTREIQACLFSYEYEFETWDMLMRHDSNSINDMKHAGAAIERKHFKDIHELMKVTQRKLSICGIEVIGFNLPYTMSSDAGEIACKEWNQPFGCCYYLKQEGLVFSLRSRDDFDVQELAKKFGGGGHKNAAGFTIKEAYKIAKFFEFGELELNNDPSN